MTSKYLASWCQLRHAECQIRVTETLFLDLQMRASHCTSLCLTLVIGTEYSLRATSCLLSFMKAGSLGHYLETVFNNNKGKLKLNTYLLFFSWHKLWQRWITSDKSDWLIVPLSKAQATYVCTFPLPLHGCETDVGNIQKTIRVARRSQMCRSRRVSSEFSHPFTDGSQGRPLLCRN